MDLLITIKNGDGWLCCARRIPLARIAGRGVRIVPQADSIPGVPYARSVMWRIHGSGF